MKNKALQPDLDNLVVCQPTQTMENDLRFTDFPIAKMRWKTITHKVCALLITSVLLKEEGMPELIGSSFLWSSSKEEYEYWDNLSQKWAKYVYRLGINE